jgi:hypothetical protein
MAKVKNKEVWKKRGKEDVKAGKEGRKGDYESRYLEERKICEK